MKRILRNTPIFLVAAALVAGCGQSEKPNIELIQDMMNQKAIKPQESDDWADDKLSMRKPPEGAVPRGFKPYALKDVRDPDEAKRRALKNPYAGEKTPEILATGKKYYDIYCAVCHGDQGAGNGPIADKMLRQPPSLVNDRVRGYSDGYVFHIITQGLGLMGSYAVQIPAEERWKLVIYLRDLQERAK